MSSVSRIACTTLLILLTSSVTNAQSVPTSLYACLDGNGNLYGVTPTGKLGEECSMGDLPVSLGSAGAVNASNGLVGTIANGVVNIGVTQGLAIPPSCPPGQIPISDGQGEWICTLPDLVGNQNLAAKVWVVTRFDGSRSSRDNVFFVNPSLESARVICSVFNSNGNLVVGTFRDQTVPSGGQRSCFASDNSDASNPANRRNWLLLVSDQPILPTAEIDGRRSEAQIEAHHVDCRDPAGYEFVCQWAIN